MQDRSEECVEGGGLLLQIKDAAQEIVLEQGGVDELPVELERLGVEAEA